MLSGELQRSSSAAKGCVARSCLVSLWYSSQAVWNIEVKLEVRCCWVFVDIGVIVDKGKSSFAVGALAICPHGILRVERLLCAMD